jgi:hypothetical protein
MSGKPNAYAPLQAKHNRPAKQTLTHLLLLRLQRNRP